MVLKPSPTNPSFTPQRFLIASSPMMLGRKVRKNINSRPKLIINDTKPTVGSSSSAPPPWIELPTDVTASILQRLGAIETLKSARKVCSTWQAVCRDPATWRVIDMKNSGEDPETYNELEILCFRSVDLSLGELIDINIEYFGTDDLLFYISNRSSRLKRLRLACCDLVWGDSLTTAVTKFPELEELHLFYMPSITKEDIEAISKCCPMLKSFTFDGRGYRIQIVDDSYALTIAKNMPNLRHLGLVGNELSDKGLRAILDGCPRLESVDLRRCFMVELQGDLDRRCSEQIKDVRYPSDSTADYEWVDEASDDDVFAHFLCYEAEGFSKQLDNVMTACLLDLDNLL